jgi:histidyl-tRNA synthetase
VYRGERAQRGRFREFYQCDIDVIGKDALSTRHDAEIPAVISAVFESLAIGDFTIRINNRKLLRGVLEGLGICGENEQQSVLREIDKTDKRGRDSTYDALRQLGLEDITAATLLRILFEESQPTEYQKAVDACKRNLDAGLPRLHVGTDPDLMVMEGLKTLIPGEWPQMLHDGFAELTNVIRSLGALGIDRKQYRVDFSIARGLDYYTGTIYETTLDAHPEIGSICSGGRYDNLASHYTKSKLPGVGISIGLTRLFWQLREAGLVASADSSVDVLVTLLDDEGLGHALSLSQKLRAGGFNVETQLEPRKLARQLQYADRAGIRFVAIRGGDEAARGVVAVKDLRRGDQFEVAEAELVRTLQVEREQALVEGGR